jgi:hypothetical protein
MSILSAIRQQSSSIDDLAKLPQAMIMQMAQRKQIATEMVAPILARKAEMIDATAKTKAMQGGVPPTSVMEQIIAQNAQSEHPPMHHQMQQPMPQQMQQPMPQQMADTGVAQLPIPDREYAGGGIIAFADGGLSDEDQDYEDSLEEADYNSMIERAMNAGEEDYTPHSASNQIPQFETRHAKGSPQSFPNSGIASLKPESSGDLDARLRAAILQKESGGHRYDKHGKLLTSHKGAEGEMQVMPYTSRDPGFGVKPARDNSPDELKRVGDEYASAMLRRYRDPILAMIAYNMGPGATDKWLAAGADPRKLSKETQGYIKNVTLAGGGEVKHFAAGGYDDEDEYSPEGILMSGASTRSGKNYGIGNLSPNYEGFDEAEWEKKYGKRKVTPPTMPPELKNAIISDKAPAKNTTEVTSKEEPKEAPKSRLDAYMDDLMASRAELKQQKTQDANLALLSAGLGMMGGTSRYALENIGKGALAGVQNFSESSKQRAAEKAALDKSMLYGYRYQGAEDLARQNATYNQGLQGAKLLEASRANTNKEIEHAQSNLNNYLKIQQSSLKDRFPAGEIDPGYQAAMAQIYRSPEYIALSKRAGYTTGAPTSTFTPKQTSLLDKYLK